MGKSQSIGNLVNDKKKQDENTVEMILRQRRVPLLPCCDFYLHRGCRSLSLLYFKETEVKLSAVIIARGHAYIQLGQLNYL